MIAAHETAINGGSMPLPMTGVEPGLMKRWQPIVNVLL